MSTSGSTNYSTTRDAIITRALRIVGAYGQGATPSANAITEGAEALNDLVKEWQADGMPLWKVTTITPFTLTATEQYSIGSGGTIDTSAPLKVLQAFRRNSQTSPNTDTPMLIIDQHAYNLLSPKTSTGTPNQLFYKTPGTAGNTSGTQMRGTIYIYNSPSAYSILYETIGLVVQQPFEDFDASTDVPDFPSYWFNAIKWGLARELCSEYGVGLAERGYIRSEADKHKEVALSFGTEEGSIFLRPTSIYDGMSGATGG
jgi:hypothetical protein